METGQVSVLVPIIVGFIGMVGIIIGQFINAWREDRRWTREQNREELRWTRTRQTEEARLHKEDVFHWREVKVKTYAKFAGLLESIENAAFALGATEGTDDWNRHMDMFIESRNAAKEAAHEIALICSTNLGELIQKRQDDILWGSPDYKSYEYDPYRLKRDSDGKLVNSIKHRFKQISKQFSDFYVDFQTMAREELQIGSVS